MQSGHAQPETVEGLQGSRMKPAPARLCKGPDGTRGFAAGRGRGLPAPNGTAPAAAAPGGVLPALAAAWCPLDQSAALSPCLAPARRAGHAGGSSSVLPTRAADADHGL